MSASNTNVASEKVPDLSYVGIEQVETLESLISGKQYTIRPVIKDCFLAAYNAQLESRTSSDKIATGTTASGEGEEIGQWIDRYESDCKDPDLHIQSRENVISHYDNITVLCDCHLYIHWGTDSGDQDRLLESGNDLISRNKSAEGRFKPDPESVQKQLSKMLNSQAEYMPRWEVDPKWNISANKEVHVIDPGYIKGTFSLPETDDHQGDMAMGLVLEVVPIPKSGQPDGQEQLRTDSEKE